jgi:hypothetical protein
LRAKIALKPVAGQKFFRGTALSADLPNQIIADRLLVVGDGVAASFGASSAQSADFSKVWKPLNGGLILFPNLGKLRPMKPEPNHNPSEPAYPAFQKFHFNRTALAAGTAAVATAAILTGCEVKRTAGVPEQPKAERSRLPGGAPMPATVVPTNSVEEGKAADPKHIPTPGKMVAPRPPETK